MSAQDTLRELGQCGSTPPAPTPDALLGSILGTEKHHLEKKADSVLTLNQGPLAAPQSEHRQIEGPS